MSSVRDPDPDRAPAPAPDTDVESAPAPEFVLVIVGRDVSVPNLGPEYDGLVKANTSWTVTDSLVTKQLLYQVAIADRVGLIVDANWGFAHCASTCIRRGAPPFLEEVKQFYTSMIESEELPEFPE